MSQTAHPRSDVPLPVAAIEETVRGWLTDYVARPHDLVGRGGAICPFVLPSLRAGSLELRMRPVGSAPTTTTVATIMRQALDEFDSVEWGGSNLALRSLLVVMPDLLPAGYQLLDDAYVEVKPVAVRRGMMIGQFHPLCREPAARNPEFPISRSPVPLVAIRPMALHDILFLTEEKDWFDEYRLRFGDHFQPRRDALDPLFVELFQNACARYGIPA
jgi:hypothetical protein